MRARRAALVSLLVFPVLARPARAGISVADGLTQEYTVEPGKAYDGTLHLKNTGDAPAQAKIYQTDYLFFCDGRNLYGKPGTDPRSNAKWIGLSRDFLTIQPNETASFNYTIRVPQKSTATLSGTYWSLIMIEEAAAPPSPGAQEKQVQVGIRQIIRYGVQIVTQVGTGGKSNVTLPKKELVKKDGKSVFELEIKNSGQRWIVPEVSLELFDSRGAKAGLFHGRKMRVYPGTCVKQEIELPGVMPGKYTGRIVIDGGEDDVFGARTELKL
ncbi:MAG: hypothetical protein NTX64_01080 [Elusimicrobia bacterium]|nr:hypothetical protein [Elusimicrobiota bacterium]